MSTENGQNPSKAVLDRIATFKFETFVSGKDNWKYYLQRFELEMSLLQLNVPNLSEYRRDLLLRAIGSELYRIVSDHFDPTPVSMISYDQLTSFLSGHNTKPVSYIIARCEFGQCVRDPTMSVSDFLAKLRSLAPDCQFGASLDERLRDQFLIGLKNPSMIERISELHRSPTDKLIDIVNSALNIEAAQRQRAAFETVQPTVSPSSNNVNQVQASQHTKRNFNKKPVNQRQNNSSSSSSKQPNATNNNSNNSRVSTSNTIKGEKQHLLNPSVDCLRCGGKRHNNVSDCKAITATCRACKKVGHYDRACVSTGRAKVSSTAVHYMSLPDSTNTSPSFNEDYRHLYNVKSTLSNGCYLIQPIVNHKQLQMEYDTAADVAVIGSQTWKKLGSPELHPSTNICGYGNAPIIPLGEFNAYVQLGNKFSKLPLIVSCKEGASLFGKNWMLALNVGPLSQHTSRFLTYAEKNTLSGVHNVAFDPDVKLILTEFNSLFNSDIGTIHNFQAKFELVSDAQPKIFKPRSVPFALKEAVAAELDRLIANDIIEPVNVMESPIEWASPIVIDVRKNGKVRICADFKVTINRFVKKQLHPLPHLNEVANKFAGFTEFSIIDLKDAFHQVVVHPSCRKYLVIATEKGYFQYKRLPFGITIAPMLFQRFMDTVFADIPGVICVQDDIAFGGIDRKDHLQRLRLVLQRLQQVGVTVHPEKVKLLQKEIVFLGHIIDANGVHPIPTKVDAIKAMPPPTNVSELRSFLGSINQFSNFIPNLLPSCQTLHRLLQKNTPWSWGKAENETFERLKSMVTSDQVLAHYDPNLPIVLSCDASEYGIGAVLQHRFPDGSLRLISAASRTLLSAERNYSSIDREALAIIFGIDKFYKYLHGRHFHLNSDHKPLERMFGEKQEIPKIAASRLVRWATQLSAFDYTLTYIPGSQNCIADALSRLPIRGTPTAFESQASQHVQQLMVETIENLSLTRNTLRSRTSSDPTLQLIIRYLSSVWPQRNNLPAEAVPYFEKRDLLAFEQGILLLGNRVVIPASIQNFVLKKLHYTHPGINAVKSLARSTVWWPKCDFDIEDFIKRCEHCQKYSPREPQTPLNLWNTPEKAWDRVHIDFTGPYEGQYWFVVIDAFSRWLEIFPMSNANTNNTIQALSTLFSRFGLPRQIVSDNGSQFTSREFKEFCSRNGIKLVFTTPYHSRSNGLVERAIRTFKWRFSKTVTEIPNCNNRLQQMLFVYRTTEHSTTSRTPAELFLGRRVNTIFDLLKPSARNNIDQRQFVTKNYKDHHTTAREFSPNDPVYVRRPIDQQWSPAVISERTSSLSYNLSTGQRVHADQLKVRAEKEIGTAPAESDSPMVTPDIPPEPTSSSSALSGVQFTPTIRRSSRLNKGKPPLKFHDEFKV